jgi:pyruvate dehydrogenase E2 component (dihydrolipoamide acetyltransferase)/2-oxoisovalerate dehydrogenase E2 component (dihydrolipoyl transacylase)
MVGSGSVVMEFRLPEIGEGVYEAELARWLVQPGAAVRPGQGLLEVLTDKATMEVPAPFSGTIETLAADEGHQVRVGQVILTYSAQGDAPPVRTKAEPRPRTAVVAEVAPVPRERMGDGRAAVPVKAAPSVRVLARKLGIDIDGVRGTGPDGRVLVEDLTAHVAPQPAVPRSAPQAADYGKPGTRIKFHGVRRRIAEHLAEAKHTIPHYTYVDECDVTDLVRLREGLKESLAKQGVRVTYVAFLIRAVIGALKDVPIVNSSLDEKAGEIVVHDRYDIGVAVSTPGGLIVPVIRNADRLSFIEVAQEVERLTGLARTGRVKLEDLRDGTFTITSIGNIGGLFATPIIHHPQVGILGVGKIVKRPVFDEHGQVRPADMVYLSLTFDHRVLDGAVGAAFGNALIQRLQHPAALLLPPNSVYA